ncbi:MAG: MFS transporter [Caulobacteraceae bacterium]
MTRTGTGEPLIHEAVGPALGGLAAAGAIGVGVNSLLMLGVMPILLGALADEGRLSAAGIGQAATVELLAMGSATAAAGMALKPARLKAIGLTATLALAGLDLATLAASGPAVLVLRAAAGAAEGALLWITVGMIARTVTPERWAGVFFTAQTAAQLVLALALAAWVMPRWGANGGFAALAGASMVGLAPALAAPSRYAPLSKAPGEGGAPPLRGWIALLASLVYVSAAGAVSVYLQPLAHQAGLSAGVARTALWVSLIAQVIGAAAATALAGKVRYFTVFAIASGAYLAVWFAYGHRLPAWLFVSANAGAGLVTLFLFPFFVPMIIGADPSRRAALQSGAAQLLGLALGPLLASLVVGERDVRGVLWLGAGLLMAGLAVVAWLRWTSGRLISSSARAARGAPPRRPF